MDAQTLRRVLLTLLGASLMLTMLCDVFLTVLYARIGTGFISHRLACFLWWTFKGGSKPFTRVRNSILSYCGPVILVTVVIVWMVGLVIGSAFIVWPALGSSIQRTGGPTPTDFATAVYIAGDSMSTVGTSDFAPQTAAFRIYYAFNSFIGIAVLTLTLTYLLEVYNALQARNTFALKLHVLTAESGDAAELVARVGAQGHFEPGYTHLTEAAAEMLHLKEAHHFYSALFYFRFREEQYALSRIALVVLDSVTLMKSALDDEEFAWVKQSAVVEQLWRGTSQMNTLLAMSFLPQQLPQNDDFIDPRTLELWRQRYRRAVNRLDQAGIKTMADRAQGEEIYVSLRAKWDRYITAFADHLAHPMPNIDRALESTKQGDTPHPDANQLHGIG